jgi:peptidoglycan/xylan/chitin deacetylase (PgdA/CDA1 family)
VVLEAARRAVRKVQRLLPATPGRTWIICFHMVESGTGLPIEVSRRQLVEHLDMLASRVEVIPLSRLVRELRVGQAPTGVRPRVVLAFDDAFGSFYEIALPLLVERSFSAVLYVPSGFINGDGNHPLYEERFAHLRPMSWDELREAASAGVEIGSHTYRHTNLNRLGPAELLDEFRRSRSAIEDRLGITPRSVCYPEGFVVSRVVRMAGHFYESGVVGGGVPIRFARAKDDSRARGSSWPTAEYLLQLPRLPVKAHMTSEQLAGFLEHPVCLEESVSDKVRRLRGRLVARN